MKNYTLVALKRLTGIVGGSTPPGDERFWGGPITWYTPSDVALVHGGTLGESARTLTDAGLAVCSASVVPAGSVVVTSRAPIGNLALTDRDASTNQGCKALVPFNGTDPRFLAYALQASSGALTNAGTGTTFQEISGGALGRLPLPAPDEEDQRLIADFLDRESDRMSLLAGGLETLASRADEPVLAELERSMAQWPRGRLGYRFEVQLGKMLDEKRVDPTQLAPYLRNANVHWDRILLDDVKQMSFGASERRKFRLVPDDLLVCEGGEPGRAAVWDGWLEECYYQKALHRVRARGQDSTRFLLWCLRLLASRGAFGADGPGRYMHLTAEDLRATEVALPPPAVQHETATKLDSRGRAARALRDHCVLTVARLAEYRDALITEAVTGKLDVSRLSEFQLDESAHAAVEGERSEVLSA